LLPPEELLRQDLGWSNNASLIAESSTFSCSGSTPCDFGFGLRRDERAHGSRHSAARPNASVSFGGDGGGGSLVPGIPVPSRL